MVYPQLTLKTSCNKAKWTRFASKIITKLSFSGIDKGQGRQVRPRISARFTTYDVLS